MGIFGYDNHNGNVHLGGRTLDQLKRTPGATLIYTPHNSLDMVEFDPAHIIGEELSERYGHNVFLTTRTDPELTRHAYLVIMGYEKTPDFAADIKTKTHQVVCRPTYDSLIEKVRGAA
jgi:hypothetical protein